MARLTNAKSIALSAMTVALTVLCIYIAAIIPTMRAAVYFLSAIIIYVLLCEKLYFAAIMSYLATSAVCFIIVPDKLALLPYVALLGHFGIFKVFIDRKISDKFIALMLKLFYCNVFTALAAMLVMFVFNINDFIIGIELKPWLIVLLAQIAFIFLNFLYTMCQQFYDTRLRSLIVSKR